MDELKGKRIFIIEDDPMNMAVYAATLKRTGAIVIQDPWNISTLHTLLHHLPIDIILLDLMLRHNIHGYDIFNQIKDHPRLQAIPVVAVSAADPDSEIPRARAKGFAGFISKPIKLYQFPMQVAQCMRGEAVWAVHENKLEDYFQR